jgi:hypothetical protein
MDQGKLPQVGDICLTLINEHHVLIQIIGEDEKTGRLSWITLDEEENNPVVAEKKGTSPIYFPKEFVIATALRLTRHLAY